MRLFYYRKFIINRWKRNSHTKRNKLELLSDMKIGMF